MNVFVFVVPLVYNPLRYKVTVICSLLFLRFLKWFFELGFVVGLGLGLGMVLGLGLGTGLALGLRVVWVLCITARRYSNQSFALAEDSKKNKIVQKIIQDCRNLISLIQLELRFL